MNLREAGAVVWGGAADEEWGEGTGEGNITCDHRWTVSTAATRSDDDRSGSQPTEDTGGGRIGGNQRQPVKQCMTI